MFRLEITVAFDVSIPESLPTFKTYRPPLTQIFQNLIQNAIKHHDREQGEIIVRAHCKGKQVEFSVADDGPGIPFEYQERVFKMFQTLRRRDEVEGSGMGLAIVKKIIEAHEGEISLDSEPGKGTTVRFTWPRQLQSTGNSRPVVDR